MEIKGFQEISFLDWPGKNPAIVFLNHCNFRCKYCHNPELALGIDGQNIPPSYILSMLSEKKDWIDSIVISGGEPTLNKGLIEFCRDIKRFLDIPIKIDTNGSNPKILGILLNEGLIDKVSMDIKAPLDDDKYKNICQTFVSISNIEKSINMICDSCIDHEFRTTVLPSLLTKDDILQIACELSCICGKVKEYTIQNFRSDRVLNEELKNYKSYDMETLEKIRNKILTEYNVIKCTIKG